MFINILQPPYLCYMSLCKNIQSFKSRLSKMSPSKEAPYPWTPLSFLGKCPLYIQFHGIYASLDRSQWKETDMIGMRFDTDCRLDLKPRISQDKHLRTTEPTHHFPPRGFCLCCCRSAHTTDLKCFLSSFVCGNGFNQAIVFSFIIESDEHLVLRGPWTSHLFKSLEQTLSRLLEQGWKQQDSPD